MNYSSGQHSYAFGKAGPWSLSVGEKVDLPFLLGIRGSNDDSSTPCSAGPSFCERCESSPFFCCCRISQNGAETASIRPAPSMAWHRWYSRWECGYSPSFWWWHGIDGTPDGNVAMDQFLKLLVGPTLFERGLHHLLQCYP
jgi:hypothetical protein